MTYWNHNTAYHQWIEHIASKRRRVSILDVGCGDGLLLERLAPLSDKVTGLEPDPQACLRAEQRLRAVPNVEIHQQAFSEYSPASPRHDLIVFVASLHHMNLKDSLTRAKELLLPGGDLVIVGLAENRSLSDWAFSALQVPIVRLLSMARNELRDPGMPEAKPRESLTDIRAAADQLLPGASIRRGLYYRYLLKWTAPRNYIGST